MACALLSCDRASSTGDGTPGAAEVAAKASDPASKAEPAGPEAQRDSKQPEAADAGTPSAIPADPSAAAAAAAAATATADTAAADTATAAATADTSAAPSSGSSPGDSPQTPAAQLPQGSPAASPWAAEVETTLGVPGPALLRVAADTDAEPGASIVWAQPVDAEGAPVGPATKLRKTSGKVWTLAAAWDGTTLWVAWSASQKEDTRSLEGLAGYDLALRQTVKTKTLRFFGAPTEAYEVESTMRMVARPGVGAGAALVAMVGTKPCRGMFFEEEGMTDCNRLALDIIGPDGSVEHSVESSLEGGDASLQDLLEVGQGVVFSWIAWRGGALTDVTFVAYDGTSRSVGTCDFPSFDLAWVDGGLLSLCYDSERSDGAHDLSCRPGNPSACGTLYYRHLDAEPRTTSIPEGKQVRYDRLALGCKTGIATMRISAGKHHIDVPADALDFSSATVMTGDRCTGPTLK